MLVDLWHAIIAWILIVIYINSTCVVLNDWTEFGILIL